MSKQNARSSSKLIDKFEDSCTSLMEVLCREEQKYNVFEEDETRTDIDQATRNFLDHARQVEVFFLQKRLTLSVRKPEVIEDENVLLLKAELERKEQLLARHNEKIEFWKTLLMDSKNQAKHHPAVPDVRRSQTLGPSSEESNSVPTVLREEINVRRDRDGYRHPSSR